MPRPLPQLAAIAYGGGKMPVPVIERALKLLPDVNFTNAYGLTETSSTITLLDPNDHREAILILTCGRTRFSGQGASKHRTRNTRRGWPGKLSRYSWKSTYAGLKYPVSMTVEVCWTVKVVPYADAGYLDEGVSFPLWTGRRRYCPRRRKHLPRRNRGSATRPDDVVDAAAVGMASEEWGEAVVLALVTKRQ